MVAFIASLVLCASASVASQALPDLHAGNMTMNFHDGTKSEPLNVVIASESFGKIPQSPMSDDLKHWLAAIGFSSSCFGRSGQPQYADLGDGRGQVAQEFLYRQDFHMTGIGSCGETLVGGNHCRGFHQAETNRWFLGCSVEENVLRHHTIAKDGYNQGRRELIKSAVAGGKYEKCTWPAATVQLLTNAGTKSADGSLYNHGVEVDGDVAYLTVNAPVCEN